MELLGFLICTKKIGTNVIPQVITAKLFIIAEMVPIFLPWHKKAL